MAKLICARNTLGATFLSSTGKASTFQSSTVKRYRRTASQFNFQRAQFKATNIFGRNTDIPRPCSGACLVIQRG